MGMEVGGGGTLIEIGPNLEGAIVLTALILSFAWMLAQFARHL